MTLDDRALFEALMDKHWRFFGHITEVQAELEMSSLARELTDRSDEEILTNMFVEEASLFERLRGHDTYCHGCPKPAEKTVEGIRQTAQANADCM